ncbi:hypothetical protein JF634_04110 [Simonsiella muelleri]|jgi:hypothetical protein|nr:hypothetical protein [Simonsiella muelleri]UBQ54678.1 hypothetical protein JF634_04110 [Simonsiella muelleri]
MTHHAWIAVLIHDKIITNHDAVVLKLAKLRLNVFRQPDFKIINKSIKI